MTADDTARTDEPTVGWVMRASDADLMLHAQVVWQQLNKRGLTEPRTAEAQEWVDTHLKVVEALETAQAELDEARDRRDYLQGQLDIIYDAEYSRNDALLRCIEKLTAAGDAVLELHKPIDGGPPDSPHKLCNHCINGVEELYEYPCPTVEAWRSVRGDTPTDGFETTDTVSATPKSTQNAAPIYWIDGDGWSVAHAVSPPWIRARQTMCGRGVPSGRDPNPHGRRCQRCASLVGEPGGEGR